MKSTRTMFTAFRLKIMALVALLGIIFIAYLRSSASFAIFSSKSSNIQAELVCIQGTALTMPFRVQMKGPMNEELYKRCEQAIWQSVHHIDTIFNRWNPKSQISLFNAMRQNHLFTVDQTLADLLVLIDRIWFLSDGLYDPTILPMLKLWQEHLKHGNCPPLNARKTLFHKIGWSHLMLKGANQIKKTNPEVEIDLNSIAKGYGVDLITEKLQKIGIKHIFVEWGGELRVVGGHPGERPWIVGVKPPKNIPSHLSAKLKLYQGAVATSGHDGQYWIATDDHGQLKAFSHIMNPHTFLPLTLDHRHILSCTVLAPKCALANALATTGLLFEDAGSAQKWAEKVCHEWENVQILFFTKDQKLLKVGGSEAEISITLL